MKEKMAYAATAVLLCATVLAGDAHSADAVASAAQEEDCEDGYPRLGCKIWRVTVEAELTIPPKARIVCETTDEWQCVRDVF